MSTLFKIKKQIATLINKNFKETILSPEEIVYPPNPEMGDLSLPCFQIAQKLNTSANLAAIDLKNMLSAKKNSFIATMVAAGPYLNISIKKDFLNQSVLDEIAKSQDKYGQNKNGKNKRVMVEYSNANTHKEYHIGHLRNVSYGDSVQKIIAANGYKAIPVSYINDFGIHVAKTLWCLNEYHKKEIPNGNKGEFLGKLYAEASEKSKDNPIANQMIALMMKKIESRAGEEYKQWQETRLWSIKQFDTIYKELNIQFEHIFYENDLIKKGLAEVKKLKQAGILVKSDGAVIADLSQYNLGVLVIIRSDGSALYPVADIPLATHKIKKYKLSKSIYIVDGRQSLYFKQLFKLLDLMGYKQDLIHLSYDFVKLPSGMMSSRTGNVITYNDLKNQIITKAKDEIIARHSLWTNEKIDEVALKLAISTMKFEMLKVDANQIITFDVNQALKFEGYTAGYIQYTYARFSSILRTYTEADAEKINPEIITKNLNTQKEHELIMKLAKYPEIVESAYASYNSSTIAKYLFELTKLCNDYYHSTPVLKAEESVKIARIILVKQINTVIQNGLALLGIEVLKEM